MSVAHGVSAILSRPDWLVRSAVQARHDWHVNKIRELARLVGMCWYHREACTALMGHLVENAALEAANPWLFEDSDLEEEGGEEEMQEDVDIEEEGVEGESEIAEDAD